MLTATTKCSSLRQPLQRLLMSKRCTICSFKVKYQKNDGSSKTNKDMEENFNVDEMILNRKQLEEDFEAVKDLQDHEKLDLKNSPRHNEDISENAAILNAASSDEFDDDDDYSYADDDIAGQILDIALQHVHEFGWSEKAIDEAVKSLDISDSTSSLFKRGAVDLVLHFVDKCNNDLTEKMSEMRQHESDGRKFSQSKFIEQAIKMRLEMLIPYINTWPQAMMLLASPSAWADCLESNANMIDEIWYHSGDLSHGMDWYTKRFALGTLYASTELFMLQDKSNNFEETWFFLTRRINDFQGATHAKTTLENSFSDVMNLVNAGITAARNIVGQNRKTR